MGDSRSSTSLVMTGTFSISSQVELTYAISVAQPITGNLSIAPTITGTLSIPPMMESQYSTIYDGETAFTPSWEDQIIQTQDKVLKTNLLILPIQTYQTSNESGITFII